MSKSKEKMSRGILFMTCALPLLFIGPAVIHFAFINKLQPLFWVVFSIGILMCLGGIFLAFRGLLKITNSIFKS